MDKQINVSKVAQIFAKEGWSFERLRLGETRWASATKQFDSAGGARTAILYLQKTQEGGLYLHGTYVSAGEDVLAGHLRLLSPKQVSAFDAILSAYLQDAERRINQSWGRRTLRAA